MALSGFTNEKKALWHEISGELRPSLTDPYIRAIFSFLTAEADNFDGVLVSRQGRAERRDGVGVGGGGVLGVRGGLGPLGEG